MAARRAWPSFAAAPAAIALIALNASAMYAGIALGAALGSVALAEGGPATLGWAGAAVECVALLMFWAEHRATAFRARAVAAPAE